MSNERKELGTSSQDQLDRWYLGWQQKIRQITTGILGCPGKTRVPHKAPNKKGSYIQKKPFPRFLLVGQSSLISICSWDGQLKNGLKWVSQHHSEPRQVSLFSYFLTLDCMIEAKDLKCDLVWSWLASESTNTQYKRITKELIVLCCSQ